MARVDSAQAFAITDPLQRFAVVNLPHSKRTASQALPRTLAAGEHDRRGQGHAGAPVGVLDLHYQSVRTAAVVLDAKLPSALREHAEVWVITGSGHHTDRAGHQRSAPSGVLHSAVGEYLHATGHVYHVGKDKAGHSGAFLVRGQR